MVSLENLRKNYILVKRPLYVLFVILFALSMSLNLFYTITLIQQTREIDRLSNTSCGSITRTRVVDSGLPGVCIDHAEPNKQRFCGPFSNPGPPGPQGIDEPEKIFKGPEGVQGPRGVPGPRAMGPVLMNAVHSKCKTTCQE